MPQFISLLTDFGYKDGFVGTLKAVISGINPNVSIIDVSHDIPPGDIDAAAFIIAQSAPFFPPNTIHCLVVDPGVGSVRKALIVETNTAIFVCPDNGILKYFFETENCRVFEISNKKYLKIPTSNTFHGRDVFAPAAAFLSMGVPVEKMGQQLFDYQKGFIKKPFLEKKNLVGEIIYIDRFGNLITNIPKDQTSGTAGVRINELIIPAINISYSSVDKYEIVALIGSSNYLEIAQRDGSAQQKLDCKIGDRVELIR